MENTGCGPILFYTNRTGALTPERKNNMDKLEQELLVKNGWIQKENNFDTEHGKYTIQIIKYHGCIYFRKLKNGIQCELVKIR